MKENKLIERLSNLLSLNYNETCIVVEKLFSEITKYLIRGECFYVHDIGAFYIKYNFEEYVEHNEEYSYIPPKVSLEFVEENSPGDKTLNDIKIELSQGDYNFPRYFKVCINTIKSILIEDSKVYIEDFGTFSYNNKITFVPDIYTSKFINPFFNLEKRTISEEEYYSVKIDNTNIVIEDISEEDEIEFEELVKGFSEGIESLETKDNYKNYINDDDEYDEEITEEFDLLEEDVLDEDSYKVEVSSIKTSNKEESVDQEKSIEDIIKEFSPPKKTFDFKENINDFNINEKNDNSDLSRNKEYKIISEKIKRDKATSFSLKKLFLVSIAIFIICFAVIVGVRSITLTKTKITHIKSDENILSIAKEYFSLGENIELSYVTPRDMYFWDVSKSIYDVSSYWPLVYALNQNSFRADKIIPRGERIVYQNLNSVDINNTNPFKKSRLNSTLSKAYISLYPVFMKYGDTNHASWVVAMSAFYDEKIFEERKYLVPDEVYTNMYSKLE